MAFKKAIAAAKKMQQVFKVTLPAGDGSDFEATFKVLTGEEGVWTLRIDPIEEDSSSYGFLSDLRTFVASIESFQEGEENLTSKDLIHLFFSDKELANPSLILHSIRKDSLEQVKIVALWEQIEASTTVEEIHALPQAAKEILWELLMKGFLLTFESDYLMLLLAHYNNALAKVKPNYIVEEFLRSTDKLLAARTAKAVSEAEATPPKEANEPEAEDISRS